MRKSILLASAAALAASCVSLSAARAQDETAQNESIDFGDIIVTATKRAQSLQDVPIAVSAVSAEQLKNAGVTDIRELQNLAPSLFLSASSSEVAGTTARVRGVGTTGDNPGLESAVAVFIDGVYRSRNNVGLTELGEVERIEVLRGPQGTLFGRNASAGLINVVTAGPKFTTGGYGEASYGNYDAIRFAGGITGAVVEDKLAARIDGVYTKRDGMIDDVVNGASYNDRDRWLLRGQMLFTPNDDLSVRLIADYSKRNENCCAAVTLVRGSTAAIIEALGGQLGSGAGGASSDDPYDRESATTPGRGFQQDVTEWGMSGEVNWDFGDTSMTSITAYRDWKAWRSQDIDYTSADILYRDTDGMVQEFKTFSQELRFNGKVGILDWLVGAYYAHEVLTLDDAVRVGSDYGAYADALVRASVPTFPGYALFRPFVQAATGSAALASLAPASLTFPEGSGVVQDSWKQTSDNWALFTHNIINVTDKFSVSLGLRYTEEKKKLKANLLANNQACDDLMGFLTNPAVPSAVASALSSLATLPCLPFFNSAVDGNYNSSRKETEWTGTAALNYKFTNRMSAYVSYAKGYKAGGFNLDRAAMSTAAPSADELQFDAEKVDAYEVGMKFRNDSGTFGINAAAFYSDFKDFQLNTFNGISYVVANLPGSTVSKGIEIETYVTPIDALMLNGGLTIASTKYDDNLGNTGLFAPPSASAPAGGALWQLAGRQITSAPKYSISGGATYKENLPGSSLMGLVHVDVRYTSDINTGSDLDAEKIQDSVFLINARIGVLGEDERWGVELWGRNLTNKNYMQVGFDGPLQGSGTKNALVNTQTFNAFLAEPRTYGITLRARF
ncbi:TonB-dependent receptor [Parapedomonas caeni]